MGRKRRKRQERINKNITRGITSENIHPKSADIEQQITEAWKLAVERNQSEVRFITPIHNLRHLESAVNRIIPNPMFKGWNLQGFATSGVCGVILDDGRESPNAEKFIQKNGSHPDV